MERAKLQDIMGKPLTQSLFLEIGYNTEFALYTFKDEDHEYKGKIYPSLKKLYLEMEDPTEYEFARTYLLGWQHWKRLCDNKLIRKQIDEWREELELQLRSKGIKATIEAAKAGNFHASKWLADRGWEQRGAGRPSKDEIEKEKKFQARTSEEYSGDVVRLFGTKE